MNEILTVSTRAGPDAVVVVASGDIDFQTSNLLRSELWNAIDDASGRLVVLDATNVEFVSSGGLAVLVTAADLVKLSHGRFLVVTGEQRVIPRALHIAGLDRFVSTSPNFPDGIAVDAHPSGCAPGAAVS